MDDFIQKRLEGDNPKLISLTQSRKWNLQLLIFTQDKHLLDTDQSHYLEIK